ncbi:glycosyl transferase [Clavibacter sp. MX14-G9D]|uniref:glycosyl transferase n=1 Tax=Clavibacter sp. MX14-G9D TaxID=3064656 RepID=UPI00293F45A5|nr:glycosyl transferase [Clavibacter sp. MX14-G9D]
MKITALRRRSPRPFVVQQSFPTPRPTTNPYLVMLGRSIARQEGVAVRTFSWTSALLRPYDVFHVHWPEILVSGHSPLKQLVRQGLTLALVARLGLTRTPLVRTLHNLELPDGISRRETLLLRLLERRTTLWIHLNEDTPEREDRPHETILHGHYRDWFAAHAMAAPVPGRIGYFGLIRRYKGVDRLLRAFQGMPGSASLQVGGRPSSSELAATLTDLARGDERIALDLRFLDDAEVVDLVRRSELVVLPYREMHNSGGALTTLSLDRPVLLPANRVNDRLAAEMGDAWVNRYEGELTAEHIIGALARVRALGPDARPDLGRREWPEAGARHVAAYRRAVALAGRRPRA